MKIQINIAIALLEVICKYNPGITKKAIRVEETKLKIVAIQRGNYLASLDARGSKLMTVIKLIVRIAHRRSRLLPEV